MKLRKRLMQTVLVAVLCIAVACGQVSIAYAAVDTTNIFTEAMDDTEELATNRWALSEEDSAAVGLDKVGKPVFGTAAADGKIALQYDNALTMDAPTTETVTTPAVDDFTVTPSDGKIALQFADKLTMPEPTTEEVKTPDTTIPGRKYFKAAAASGKIALQYDRAVAISELQYVELTVKLEGLQGTSGSAPTLFMGFAETKATDSIDMTGDGIKVQFNQANPTNASITMISSESGARWRDSVGGQMHNANEAASVLLFNAFGGGGISSYTDMTLTLRVCADGRSLWYINDKEHSAEHVAVMGWTHNGGWVKETGFKPLTSGYPQIAFENVGADVNITDITVGVYSYADNLGDGLTGNKVSGAVDYVEDFASVDDSDMKSITGTVTAEEEEGETIPGKTETVTTYAKEFIEAEITLKGLSGTPSFAIGFADTKATGSVAAPTEGVKLELKSTKSTTGWGATGVEAALTMLSDNTDAQWRNPWGANEMRNAGTRYDLESLYNGNGAKGVTEVGELSLRYQLRADGRASLAVKDGTHDTWFGMSLGWRNSNGWIKEAGFTPQNEGYLQLLIENLAGGGNITVSSFKVSTYTYTDAQDTVTGTDDYTGTKKTDATDYTETFAEVNTSKLEFVSGTAAKHHVDGESTTTTTYAKQYAEFTASFAGISGTPTVFFGYANQKAASLADIESDDNEGISLKFLGNNSVTVKLQSNQEGAEWRMPWGTNPMIPAGEEYTMQSVGGGTGVSGVPGTSIPKIFTIRLRIYADGSGVCSVRDSANTDWYYAAPIGLKHDGGWKKTSGFAPVNSGYPQILVTGVSNDISVTGFTARVYDYSTVAGFDVEKGENGVLVTGSDYEESFASVEDSTVKFLAGTTVLAPAASGIVIDNAASGDYLIKKTPLSAPTDDRTDVIYEIKTDLFIEELAGSGRAVVYLGADDTELTGATLLKFAAKDSMVTLAIDGAAAVETRAKRGSEFTLQIICGGNVGETPYLNEVYVDGVKAGEFTKNMIGKYIAFGTTDVSDGNTARFAVMNMSIVKHSYTPGDGGDFTETFDDNLYNFKNVTIHTPITHVDPNTIFQIKDGAVVSSKDCGYTSVISSTQTYGDFEFMFEISAFGDNGTDYSDFMISWGRPSGDSDYAAGGTSVMLMNSALVCLDPKIDITSTALGVFPTAKKDEGGTPLGTSTHIGDYDFTKGNLVFKVVKSGTEVKIYLWLADSEETDASRTTPVCTITNDYCGAGTVGICAVPTDHNMALSVDKFSVKNTDEFKNSSLIVGADSDRIELVFETDNGGDDPIIDPTQPGNKGDQEPQDEGCGCGGSVAGTVSATAAALLIACAAVLARRKKQSDK